MRKLAECTECAKTRELAAHGLCFKCYRAKERTELAESRPDRHAKALAQSQKRTRKALMKIVDALEELDAALLVPSETVEYIRSIIRPEVARIAHTLATVNSEQEDASEQFTAPASAERANVNSAQAETSERLKVSKSAAAGINVNTEHSLTSEQFTADYTGLLPPTIPQRVTKLAMKGGK